MVRYPAAVAYYYDIGAIINIFFVSFMIWTSWVISCCIPMQHAVI